MKNQPFANTKFIISEVAVTRLPPSSSEIAFVGRSNVGKSTLINAIIGKDLARTSSTPGRTRTINVYGVADQIFLVDLPGYGFAQGPAAERASWGEMIEGYLASRPGLKMVYVVVDAKVGPTQLDRQMVVWLQAARLPWQAVATKADQVKTSQSIAHRRDNAKILGLLPDEMRWISAQEGLGIKELRLETSKHLGLL